MGKDVILDRYARLYEIPFQLARLGHQVRGYCLSYQGHDEGSWEHEAAPGSLHWQSASLGKWHVPGALGYPSRMLRELRAFQPDIVIGASDIPQVVLGGWLARKLGRPYVADLYDNFEGFGQGRIPGFVSALRHAVRHAQLVLTTSDLLAQLVTLEYHAKGKVIAMPSSVDLDVFCAGDQATARDSLGLPKDVSLVGTAGGLYKDKGIEVLYAAWKLLAARRTDVHLVLAGPTDPSLALPQGDRVHYLGALPHTRVADVFRALDVGIMSVLDTPFGKYCFPQKAYEMLGCKLPLAVADVGAMAALFAAYPSMRFKGGDAQSLATVVAHQLDHRELPAIDVLQWSQQIAAIEPELRKLIA
ncbi:MULTISPECIES: glycosyltransferase family 4 protein [Dyella]|nr:MULTISPECIES: glycosyltransferase family 4 protein [Dyella]